MNASPSGAPDTSSQSRTSSAALGNEDVDVQSLVGISNQLQVTKSRLQAVSEELAMAEASSVQNELLGRAALDAARSLWIEEKNALERCKSELVESEAESRRECEALKIRLECVLEETNTRTKKCEALSKILALESSQWTLIVEELELKMNKSYQEQEILNIELVAQRRTAEELARLLLAETEDKNSVCKQFQREQLLWQAERAELGCLLAAES